MMGGRHIKEIIEKSIDKLYDGQQIKIDKNNNDKVHAIEASRCVRLSYYERKDPLQGEMSAKMSFMLSNGLRRVLHNVHGEYKLDGLTLEADADMIVEEFVLRFEVVQTLPETPHPRHMLYLNACLFAFNKPEGVLIYITPEGKSVEFSVTKNNRMFEEIVRRGKVLSTLLKDNKVPIVEPSDLCFGCKYFERCYARERRSDDGDFLAEIFGKKSK